MASMITGLLNVKFPTFGFHRLGICLFPPLLQISKTTHAPEHHSAATKALCLALPPA